MVCNIMSGKIFKGSIAEITVPMFPRCYTGETEDLVVDFYVDGDTAQTSIEFSISAGTITLDEYFNGTVVFQDSQLGVLPDGLLKYTTTCGDEYLKEWETRYFICTPQNFTPVEYVTQENVEEVVTEYMGDYVTKTEAEDTYLSKVDAQSTYLSKTDAQGTYLSKTDAQSTYAKKTDIPDVSNFITSGDAQTIVNSSLTSYSTTSQVEGMISAATSDFVTSGDVATTLEDYAKLTDIPSLDGYATEQYVDNAVADCPTSSTISTIWLGTQQEYDAIPTKDNATLYIIK